MYSIKEELTILRKYMDMEYDGNRRCYSEADISAAEARLRYKFPAPVKELYLLMADVLLDLYDLRPLELLHWQQDYLGFFDSPEMVYIWGICRNDHPNALYAWEEEMPEEAQSILCDYEEEFEACVEAADEAGKQSVALKYAACWDDLNARYTEAPPNLQKLENKFRCNCSLDAYGLFLAIYALSSYATELYCLKSLDCWVGDFPETYNPAYFERLRENIEREFRPISAHWELIDMIPLPMAYVHNTANVLLLSMPDDLGLTLLSDQTADPSLIDGIQNRLALSFRRLLPFNS